MNIEGRSTNACFTGPSSMGKTATAIGVSKEIGRLSQYGIKSVVLPRGFFFREAAEQLHLAGMTSENLSEDPVNEVLKRMPYTVEKGIAKPVSNINTSIKNLHQNGILATLFSKNPIFQHGVSKYLNTVLEELHSTFPVVLIDGRIGGNTGELSFFFTGGWEQILAIKKKENPEVRSFPVEDIKADIANRDRQDFINGVLSELATGYVVFRDKKGFFTQRKIEKTIAKIIVDHYRGVSMPKSGIVFPKYSSF